MKELAYYDGQVGTPEEVMVPFNDRVHFFGDGVYEATLGGNHKVFLLQDHLDRFYSSARALEIRIPMEKQELGALLTDLLSKVEGTTHFVYWQVTRGVDVRNHTYSDNMMGKLWVSIRPFAMQDPEKDIAVITKEDTRFLHCDIKTLNLLPNVMAAQKAREAGCSEAVFVRDGYVTEGSHSNISIIKDGVFITHPLDNLILPGTERKHMLAYCKELGIPTKERAFTLEELAEADEIIVSSTSHPSMRAMELDKKAVGMKNPELVEKLRKKYMDEIEAL